MIARLSRDRWIRGEEADRIIWAVCRRVSGNPGVTRCTLPWNPALGFFRGESLIPSDEIGRGVVVRKLETDAPKKVLRDDTATLIFILNILIKEKRNEKRRLAYLR